MASSVMASSVSGREREEVRGESLRGSLTVGFGLGWLLEGEGDWRDEWEWPRGAPNEKCAKGSSSSSSSVGESVRGALVGVEVDGLRGEERRGVVDVESVEGEGEVNDD